MKSTIIITILALFTSPAWATNYFNKDETCLKRDDVVKVQSHFTQLQDFTSGSEDQICKDQEIDSKWFEVARSILAMKQLNDNDNLQRDPDDDLTLQPIEQKDWWGYFTERANRFQINGSQCREGVVAYVFPFFRGQIFLCSRFFEMSSSNQIEVLMHEVRHFDGHRHVTCTQGNERGNPGACDTKIEKGGSYAVGVQVAVELSYAEQLNAAERALAEASAVYAVNNKFNSLPVVRSRDYVYLSNEAGEIHRADTENLSQTELIASLEGPAKVYGNGQNFTVFPLDTSQEAYRVSRDLNSEVSAIGAFADQYNADSVQERELYNGINYYGEGAISRDNVLYTFCGQAVTGLSSFEFENGDIRSILNLKIDGASDETFILSESGEVYDFKCDNETGVLSSTKQEFRFPRDTVEGFSFEAGLSYILNENGEFLSYDFENETLDTTELPRDNWLSATPLKVYEVFDSVETE